MLFLNKTEIAAIEPELIQNAVYKSYELVLSNAYTMPDRVHVEEGENTLLLMPCFSGSYFATKLVSVFPGAPKMNLPAVNGIMTLADNQTGKPLAIMDGAAVTAQRTGAVGGLGAALLTRTDLNTAGVFGAGVQGYSQARYLLENRNIKTLYIGDLYQESAQKMADILAKEFADIDFKVASTPVDLVRESELIIAATTSKAPLFENDPDLVKGKTFISIGSFRPDMKEFPDAVITGADHIYVDTPFAAKESGDICVPLERKLVGQEDIIPFAQLVQAPIPLDDGNGNSKTLFFKSVGMALFDLAVASAIYELAVEEKFGVNLEF